MARATKAPTDPDDAPLKRLGGGRWQTRDDRFTIEPQSGTWVIVDGEQVDDFGLALVRGPYPSLTAAKAAISGARTSEPPASPLAARITERERARQAAAGRRPATSPRADDPAPSSGRAEPTRRPSPGKPGAHTAATKVAPTPSSTATPTPRTAGPRVETQGRTAAGAAEAAQEPSWISELEPAERGRARRAIDRLRDRGAADAEGLVRRDLVGDVPAIAAEAIRGQLAALGTDARPDQVAELLVDGRDPDLGVRWRLVDGEGRPILLDPGPRRRR